MSLRHREFWQTYWIAIRRCRTDSRARRIVIRISVGLLILPSYLGFWAIVIAKSGSGLWIILFDGFALALAALVVMALRKSHQREDALFSFVSAATPEDAGNDNSDSAVHQYLLERTIIVATLLARAASEAFLKSKYLPDGVAVVTRQAQLEELRKQELWEKIKTEDGDLLRIADGHWTPEQINLMVQFCERLRLLRWVLGLDATIIPLALFPKPDASLTIDVRKKRQSLFSGKKMLEPWDVRLERDIARGYLLRCLAEQQSRGLINGVSEFAEWAKKVQSELASASEDMLVGVKAVSELDDDELMYFSSIAVAREDYANYLIDQLTADQPIDYLDWSSTNVAQGNLDHSIS